MNRARDRLSVRAIQVAGEGKLMDGAGLMLIKRDLDAGKWIFRYSIKGRRREMGLGGWPDVSLAQARRQRERWAEILRMGQDPISARENGLDATLQQIDRDRETVAQAIEKTFESRKDQLRGDGTRGRWMSPLSVHILPKLGNKPLVRVEPQDIADALRGPWRKTPEAARKALTRLRLTFEHAHLRGMPVGAVTVERAGLILGAQTHEAKPIAATPWQDVPALWARLAAHETTAHLCLRLLILTGVRASSATGARFEEFDGATWTIPADRIKGLKGSVKDFRVPLSPPALEIVAHCRKLGGQFLFATHKGRPITVNGLELALNKLGEAGRPHGFRTSLRTWVQDTGAASWDVAETALGHAIGTRVERAYARSDLLERRRDMMDAWARHVVGVETP